MQRLCVLVCALLFGCTSDGQKDTWEALPKDMQGGDIHVSGDYVGAQQLLDGPPPAKAQN